MIPENILNQIQERVDIVEIVSGYVPLKRAGKNFKANCPFHQERTPSFMVNPDKQIFHCFGCNAGGNVFGFLMKIEKKDFREVVEELAERTGVEIPKDRPVDTAAAERANSYLKAHRLAAEFFQGCLAERRDAEPARTYIKKRGLKPETLAAFQIGFAPDSWNALYDVLKGLIPDAVLERTGLVIKKDGGFYDRFRGRVMFPILDAKGNCVAFGARVLDDSTPKYLNSPETEIYSKGRNLYGLFQAKQAIREKDSAIVVEGYMDLIGCYQAGVRHVVASLGTALTSEQVRLVKRLTRNVTMLYDADAAGELATLRGLELFLEEGMDVKIVRLAAGHDPDSFIKEKGAARFQEALDGAKTLFEYKLALLKQTFDARSVEGKVRIANDLVGLFSKVSNEILRAAWIAELSRELGLSEEALVAEMKKNVTAPKPARREPAPSPAAAAVKPVEKLIIGLLIGNPDLVGKFRHKLRLEAFENPKARQIVQAILDEKEPVSSMNRLISLFSDDAEAVEIISTASAESEGYLEKEKALDGCLARIGDLHRRRQIANLAERISRVEKEGDRNRIRKFMADVDELNKREKKIDEEA